MGLGIATAAGVSLAAMMLNFKKTNKIAITGIAGGGKTVFLSSLLWQLAEFDDADFYPGSQVKISGWRELSSKGSLGEVFPFDKYRDALARSHKWPDKTTDCYRFSCEYKRSDWKRFSQRLDFFDFPGERIADAAIAAYKDYGDWSDHILKHFESNSDYNAALLGYKQVLEAGNLDEAKLLSAYRKALACLILGYKPLISPSVFLLDTNGDSARPATEEALASARLCGLDEESQFAPLPEAVRGANPELAKKMARNYKLYRKQIALPLYEELADSQSLIILIDIPSLLAGGVGRYNDNRQIVLDLIDAVRTDTSIGKRLKKLLRFWSGSLKRIAFVATKADLVLPGDLQNGNLMSLLRQMNTRAKNLLPDIEMKWFVCSACRSTSQGNAENTLIGKPIYNNPDRKDMEFEVTALPEAWPDNWMAGEYKYYSVYPETSQNIQIPPKHIGLDRVFEFVAG